MNPHFIPIEILDLNKAVVRRVSVDNEIRNQVTGDQSTFVSNGTITNSVDPDRPFGAPVIDGCLQHDYFAWNATEKFNYTLSFSNSSASATFHLATTKGTVALRFSGNRVDGYYDDYYYVYLNPGNFTIALNTSDLRMPVFQWSNDTEISRATASKTSGYYYAESSFEPDKDF